MSSLTYTSHSHQFNEDITAIGWAGYGNGLIDDDNDANGVYYNNEWPGPASIAFQTVPFVFTIPSNSSVNSVVVRYRGARSAATLSQVKPYTKFANGNFVYAASNLTFTDTFTNYDVNFPTNPSGAAWSVDDFINARYGLQSQETDGTILWSELEQTINFILPSPTVTTNAASNVTLSTVQLNGTLNPNGATSAYPVTYKFQWGLTTAYGNETSPVVGNTGSSPSAIFENLTGLTGSTTYHYRLVAFNDDVTSNGADQTFFTSASDPVLMRL